MSSLTRDLQASRYRFAEAERAHDAILDKNEMLTWHDKLASCMASKSPYRWSKSTFDEMEAERQRIMDLITYSPEEVAAAEIANNCLYSLVCDWLALDQWYRENDADGLPPELGGQPHDDA
jgi:hypothetical protein